MSSLRWFYKIYPPINKKSKRKKKTIPLFKKKRLTPQKLKQISHSLYYIKEGGKIQVEQVRHVDFLRCKRLYNLVLRTRQLLRILLGFLRFKSFKQIYTKLKNNRNNRLHLSNFFSLVEWKICPLLYSSFLITKPNFIKQLLHQKLVKVGNLTVKKRNYTVNPTDILRLRPISVTCSEGYTNYLNKKFKKLLKTKFKSLKKIFFDALIIKQEYISSCIHVDFSITGNFYRFVINRSGLLSQFLVLKSSPKLNALSATYFSSNLYVLNLCNFLNKVI